ncbi:MAG: NAD(P)-dependent oxidoreductase [Paludibacteraceae bacterium]|nr:NAD(P)-dependent oxidoreductase [Paludibacteraceae bacterium]
MKIVFTTTLPHEGLQRLANTHGVQLVMPEKELLDIPSFIQSDNTDAEILVATFDYTVSKELIDSMPNLQLIANFGVGYNNIDLDACRARGIRVTNTPQPVIEPTAELAFALMIDIARRVSEFDRKIRGIGAQTEPIRFGVMQNLSHSLYGKTLGIIGMGRIGLSLARRALASGMKVIYHNRKPRVVSSEYRVVSTKAESLRRREEVESQVPTVESAQYVDFQTLLQDSDFVSLNLPYTPESHHIIGKPELGMMKRSAYLINTARGAHIDEKALVEALQSGIIAGAAMDVYEHEPQINPELLTLNNVVLSPHTGTGTWEGRIAMCENVAENILAFMNNEIDKMNIVL